MAGHSHRQAFGRVLHQRGLRACVADVFSYTGGILTSGSGATESSDVSYATPISFITKVLHDTKLFEHAHLNGPRLGGHPKFIYDEISFRGRR